MNSDPSAARVRFTDMAYGGDAVGRDPESGIAVFAWPAIAGEDATVRVTSRGKNLVRGVVTELHEVSPSRVAPPCPYFGSCGGCQWQQIRYEAQLDFKHGILRSQLTRFGGVADVDGLLRPPIGSPKPYGYRNSSHFAIDLETRSLAYFRRDTHTLIPVLDCPISNDGINRAIPFVNTILEGALDAATPPSDMKGLMRLWKVSIRSSEGTGQTLIVLHSRAGGKATPRPQHGRRQSSRPTQRPDDGPNTEAQPEAHPVVLLSRREVRRAIGAIPRGDLDGMQALLVVEVMDDGTINRLGETRSSSSAASDAVAEALTGVLLGEGMSLQGGPPLGAWIERLGGRNYWVHPESFFQVNTAAGDLLLQEVADALPARMNLLVDAHAGVGTFALAFARRAKRTLGFETDNGAIQSGLWTARAWNLNNVEFKHGRSEALIAALPDDTKIDCILLDPPRAGCHPALLAEIVRRKVPRIIYVSCDPSTLARDVKVLSGSHRLSSARLVDMFPQTYHLETVAVLDLL
jgi:23S rRNA (uracil1939-C5)-methyltransferase